MPTSRPCPAARSAAWRWPACSCSHPDLLLLDEPTNHLDAESVEWLERFLGEYAGTVVAVTHDRYFLDNVAKWILELDRGRGIPFAGNYSSWLEQKLERMTREQKQVDARQRTLARELEWVRMGAKARQAKGKARLSAYERLLAEANDDEGPDPRARDRDPARAAPGRPGHRGRRPAQGLRRQAPHRGPDVLAAAGRHRRASSGPNGAGKTTLFRMLVGQEAPDAGLDHDRRHRPDELRRPEPRRPGRRQDRVRRRSPRAPRSSTVGKRELPARAYVSSFNFRGTDQQKLVGQLSGGERNRVHLAKLLQTGGNVLLLDEPTNDLDVDTLRALEAGLESFPGCVVVISHDRWFLDRIATHILAFEGDSQVRWFEGNVSDYEAFRHRELGTAADQPHRIRYKRLTA